MRFTRLRLNGFKSFVDPTDLVIADGLTGVVGPNGCGKSNLLEALRWVMGENRPTAMRGGGMEDVIFAGAATRGARNFAEVSLHIDNAERLAPSGFNDADQLDIVRRITRDVGSAYKANTKDVRARDVQMLFADASTGAHSPALVRQGQISELINAKPKARRRILEEAAGISGLYQRRHEAELKLKGAETNLARVDDVLEQLASQLSSLARQARQAARYREIGEALRRSEGLLLYRRWKEADEALAAAQAALTQRTTDTARAEQDAVSAAKTREAAEADLPPLREEEAIAAAVLQRLLVQRDTLSDQEAEAERAIERLASRLEQLTNDITREETLNKDAGETIERLEWEQAELAKAGEGHEGKLEAASEAARDAAQVLQDREASLSELTEDVARLAARHQATTRLLEDTRKAEARAETEATKASDALAQARDTVTRAEAAFAEATRVEAEAAADASRAEKDVLDADTALAETSAQEAEARAARSEADGIVAALSAELQALKKLVERDAGDGQQLLDHLVVDPGFEKALGAALADDLKAPIVTGDGSGWVVLPGYDKGAGLPAGAAPLSDHVRGAPALARRLGHIGVVARAEGDRLQAALSPGQRLVSPEGDCWRWDGHRARAEDAPSAAALRLEQVNRMGVLRQDLEGARNQAGGATAAHETLRARLKDLTEADRAAREARRSADMARAEASRAMSKAEADRNLAAGRVETQSLALARFQDEATAARAQVTEAQGTLDGLPDLDEARAKVDEVKITVEASRVTMMQRRSAHDELRREGEARLKRQQEATKEISGWRHRLETAASRIKELDDRRSSTEEELATAQAAPGSLADAREALGLQISEAEARKAAAADVLSTGEATLRAATDAERTTERTASEAREARAAAQARRDAAQDGVTQAAERISDEHEGTEPETLLETLSVDPEAMPTANRLEADVTRLRRQRDALGAVNLRAEEDAREVQEEHDTLQSEKTDLEDAIRALRSGIASLNKEGRERLLTAFEEVNRNFSNLFRHLFGGGEANLVLVESDDPLEAGLEIMCQPPGKKLSTLSLLSGGEQTLTALALIFAVFLANPAPICVLDEVDAPLDDANVTRFCDLLDEMTRRTDTRFLIITHHAVTMSRMDRLFGVTMAEQGVSQLVSVDLKRAEQMVA